ncbi:MAG: 6-phosphogluconolactonase [Dysgonamonadaceae bacterium]|jgi:6-phosphogluconolactonase|nr:6-phosphogluconolactonase [Dysgonamonadaceae bacterium]
MKPNIDIEIITACIPDIYARFTDWFKSVLNASDGTLNLALSGGNTPKALFEYWTANHQDDIDWTRVRFFWSDERCVPPNDEQSNYRMTKEYLFDRLPVSEGQIFRIEGENEPFAEAKRYAEVLRRELKAQNEIPSFDIVMLGMGDDGHTASIFPHQIALWDSPEICVVGTHPQSGQQRVSLSGKTINAAKNIAFLVTGKSKAERVREIIETRGQAERRYPAAKAAAQSGNLLWFLDNDAAALLNP